MRLSGKARIFRHLRLHLHIPETAPARNLLFPDATSHARTPRLLLESCGNFPGVQTPVRPPIFSAVLGSGVLHSITIALAFIATNRWDSSQRKTSAPSSDYISVSFSTAQSGPDDSDSDQTERTTEPTIPERTETPPPFPDQEITNQAPILLAVHLSKPKYQDSPPLEQVTVSEGPQFKNSFLFPEPEPVIIKPKSLPLPSKLKRSSTPPGSSEKRKKIESPTKKPSIGISRSVRLKSRPSVRYPAQARAAGIQGSCTIEVVVSSSGRVSSVKIVRSSGNRSLDAEALRCARSASFHPAMKNGKTLSAKARLPFRFRVS